MGVGRERVWPGVGVGVGVGWRGGWRGVGWRGLCAPQPGVGSGLRPAHVPVCGVGARTDGPRRPKKAHAVASGAQRKRTGRRRRACSASEVRRRDHSTGGSVRTGELIDDDHRVDQRELTEALRKVSEKVVAVGIHHLRIQPDVVSEAN